MERTLGKPRILELYLNTVDWGPGVCGARSAARTYFGKPPARLTALESAWLAASLRNPRRAYEREFLSGHADPARARSVLAQMRTVPARERARSARQSLVFASAPRLKPVAAWAAAMPQ
jgi:membrane peptidoglycan carboxypeptidase